jgi:hypothetical protein
LKGTRHVKDARDRHAAVDVALWMEAGFADDPQAADLEQGGRG